MSQAPWIYKGKPITCIEDCPKDSIGFVYRIVCSYPGISDTGTKIYIGRKILYNNRRTVISKRAKKLKPTRKKYNSVTVESDWKIYWGSCIPLLEQKTLIEDKYWSREIIEFCYSKRELNYKEVFYQFKFSVLEEDTWNNNILGKFYRLKK